MSDTAILLEESPFEVDGGHVIGRDPRKIPAHEFDGAGIAGAWSVAAARTITD